MAKGPKRQKGRIRTKSGRISRSKAAVTVQERSVMDVVLNQPHRAWLGGTRRIDQLAECALGRLFLSGKITEPELWAGQRWSKIVADFHVVLASPVSTMSSALGRMVGEGVENAADADHLGQGGKASTDEALASERPETDEEMRERVLQQHGGAMRQLSLLTDSRSTFLVMERVIVQDVGEMEDGDLHVLRRGLRQLAHLWRMTPPPDPLEARHGPRVAVQTWRNQTSAPANDPEKEISSEYVQDSGLG